MKLQGMTIVYVLIILPIFFVVSIVISTQIQIINARMNYDKKVLGAAQDAIKSFELNTANEEFSKVSDVLRSIVEASVNVFKDSLGTKLGMSNVSKQYIDTFFPLGVFTLYDGYYISSPTKEPLTLNNSKGNAIHIDDDEATNYSVDNDLNVNVDSVDITKKSDTNTNITQSTGPIQKQNLKFSGTNTYKPIIFETNNGNRYTTNAYDQDVKKRTRHVLKNYIPYSAKYSLASSGGNNDDYIFVNYTIDNYISIYGKKSNFTYNKAGYLLDKDTTVSISTTGGNPVNNSVKKDPNILENKRMDLEKTSLEDFNGSEKNFGTDKQIEELVDRAREQGKTITLTVINDKIARYNSNEDIQKKEIEKSSKIDIVYDPKDDKTTIAKPNKSLYANGANGGDEAYLNELNKYNAERAYADQQINAIKYYLKAYRFSNWVRENFGNLKESDKVNDDEAKKIREKYPVVFEDFKNDNKIFSDNILDQDSTFNDHKRKVIKDNIQYNLIVAAINYNMQKFGDTPEFKLPQILDTDWDKIINSVSFVVFAEGLRSK